MRRKETPPACYFGCYSGSCVTVDEQIPTIASRGRRQGCELVGLESGICVVGSPRKAGRIPRVSTRFSLSMENVQTDPDGMGQSNPSRETKISGAKRDKEIFLFPVQLTTSRIGNITRLIRPLL